MSAHSRLAPSAADRWVHCPASVGLSEQFPELLDNPAAAEGTAAHWVAYAMLTSHTPQVGEFAPNGVAVTEEMLEGALLYYNHVFKLANPHGNMKSRFRYEQTEYMPSIHPECYGTPDGAGILDILELTGEIHVFDYKYGHLEVDPRTLQLVLYLRGIIDRLGLDGLQEQHVKVHLHIIQPRCYTASGPIRTYSGMASDFRGDWNRLHAAAHEALAPNPRFKVGDHCKYCPGRRACAALKREAAAAQDYIEHLQPIALQGDALGLELQLLERSLSLVQYRATGLREQAEAAIRSGNSVPGWTMESGRSTTKWAVPVDEVLAMGEQMGKDLRKPAEAITPKQAEKKGIDRSVIEAYSSITPGKMSLAPDNLTKSSKVFSK